MVGAALTIRGIRTRAVSSPMRRPISTSVGSISTAPLVLIDMDTEEGIVGRAYLFSYLDAVSPLIQRAINDMVPSLIGSPVEPTEVRRRAARPFQLLGTEGIIGLCLSGLDIACWDALAKAADMPLARLLGGSVGPTPVYNSNGLGIMPSDQVGEEALELLDEGFSAIKARLGYPQAGGDMAVVQAIRNRIPRDAILMSDFNHCLSTVEAIRRCRMLDDEGLYWIEEPTAHDDYPGNARVARAVATPIQLGENFTSLRTMQAALDQEASDLVMLDLQRIGGVTGWMQAAALAAAQGVPVSSHLFPEVSCHLMAVTPTRHWLEYVDWAARILTEPLVVSNGQVNIPERPGNGLSWDDDAVRHYSVD